MAFQLDIGPPSDEAKEIARRELRETPDVVKTSLEELRKLLDEDQTLSFKSDDVTLTAFLRPCKWYPKSAYDLMKRVADYRKKHKEMQNLYPEAIKETFTTSNVVNVLKNRDHKGRRVLLINCGGSWDTSKVSADDLLKVLYVLHEAAILEDETQIRGIIVIMDFKDMGMKQVKAFSPSFSLKLLTFIQDAMPLRLKEIHMTFEPAIFSVVWNIFKPFIKDKLKKRIFFHGNKMESLHKHVDSGCLPQDFGGQLEPIDYNGAQWYPCVETHMYFMKTWASFGYK